MEIALIVLCFLFAGVAIAVVVLSRKDVREAREDALMTAKEVQSREQEVAAAARQVAIGALQQMAGMLEQQRRELLARQSKIAESGDAPLTTGVPVEPREVLAPSNGSILPSMSVRR